MLVAFGDGRVEIEAAAPASMLASPFSIALTVAASVILVTGAKTSSISKQRLIEATDQRDEMQSLNKYVMVRLRLNKRPLNRSRALFSLVTFL